ncbi:S8 family peptidase [Vibrio diabolicus]|uniref:S8 family peptidase n=1 Tax=Vibrio diabolicus TaxID=50719 RepID=UPI00215E8C69|nr:S8 family peptidase [Vibrio diabolicus]MCS0305652.1 S8 family peptidase [Vibrio diabolicus]
MSRHPLLLFRTPEPTTPSRRTSARDTLSRPTPSQQYQRLLPKLNKLTDVLSRRAVEIQSETSGIDPEYTLVLETYGNIENFYSALSRIEGFEWLGEHELRDLSPESEFFDSRNETRDLNGRAMLVLTDRQAIRELLSLWDRYQREPERASDFFPRGWGNLKKVFEQLKDIRYWDTSDRLRDTGIIEYWEETIEYDGERPIQFEAELWFRGNQEKRTQAHSTIMSLVRQLEGRVITSCCIEQIQYHSMLLELPVEHVNRILQSEDVALVKNDAVMLFRPVGQMCVDPMWDDSSSASDVSDELPVFQGAPLDLADVSPKVALLDGLPLANHTVLAGKLRIDDPDNIEEFYPADKRIHGTAMASLIVNGDLSHGERPLSSPLYVRPILKPDPTTQDQVEAISRRELPVDVIHRAVKRMFEGDGDEDAVAPAIKVINLSFGDPFMHFDGRMSPLARLIDWLSVEYNVLFIVSAGNHASNILVDKTAAEFRDHMSDEERVSEVFKTIESDSRNRKLLSPAESVNALTVGAIHYDDSTYTPRVGSMDLYDRLMPATYSAHGNGYKRSVKPDLVCPGGRVLYSEPYSGQADLRGLWRYQVQPGISVPYPDSSGNLSRTAFTRGTSNSAALTSRRAMQIYDTLTEVFSDNEQLVQLEQFAPVLIKALMAHGCSWNELMDNIGSCYPSINRADLKNIVTRHLGYGVPDIDRVLYSLDNRATILGFGGLTDSQAHVYKLPIPEALGGVETWRKLTVSLAWLATPCPSNLRYRDSALWFSLEGDNSELANTRTHYDHNQVRRGTLQHEIFEGSRIEILSANRELEIKVNCKKDAGRIVEPVKYGLAITLEVAPSIDMNVYESIRDMIQPRVQEQARTQIQTR